MQLQETMGETTCLKQDYQNERIFWIMEDSGGLSILVILKFSEFCFRQKSIPLQTKGMCK